MPFPKGRIQKMHLTKKTFLPLGSDHLNWCDMYFHASYSTCSRIRGLKLSSFFNESDIRLTTQDSFLHARTVNLQPSLQFKIKEMRYEAELSKL